MLTGEDNNNNRHENFANLSNDQLSKPEELAKLVVAKDWQEGSTIRAFNTVYKQLDLDNKKVFFDTVGINNLKKIVENVTPTSTWSYVTATDHLQDVCGILTLEHKKQLLQGIGGLPTLSELTKNSRNFCDIYTLTENTDLQAAYFAAYTRSELYDFELDNPVEAFVDIYGNLSDDHKPIYLKEFGGVNMLYPRGRTIIEDYPFNQICQLLGPELEKKYIKVFVRRTNRATIFPSNYYIVSKNESARNYYLEELGGISQLVNLTKKAKDFKSIYNALKENSGGHNNEEKGSDEQENHLNYLETTPLVELTKNLDDFTIICDTLESNFIAKKAYITKLNTYQEIANNQKERFCQEEEVNLVVLTKTSHCFKRICDALKNYPEEKETYLNVLKTKAPLLLGKWFNAPALPDFITICDTLKDNPEMQESYFDVLGGAEKLVALLFSMKKDDFWYGEKAMKAGVSHVLNSSLSDKSKVAFCAVLNKTEKAIQNKVILTTENTSKKNSGDSGYVISITSSLGAVAGAIIGGIIGFFIGGPIGAAIGIGAGATAGAIVALGGLLAYCEFSGPEQRENIQQQSTIIPDSSLKKHNNHITQKHSSRHTKTSLSDHPSCIKYNEKTQNQDTIVIDQDEISQPDLQ